MADQFEQTSAKLARLAIGQVPVLGLVVEAVAAFLPPNADARLKAAVEADLSDTVIRLERRVEELAAELQGQGKKLDEIGAVRTVGVAREFARGVIDAQSPGKVLAIVNATAHQFDPRMGAPESRAYWLRKVLALGDREVHLVRLLSHHKGGGFQDRWLFPFGESGAIDIGEEDCAALLDAALALSEEHRSPLVHRGDGTATLNDQELNLDMFSLTDSGRVVAKFIDSKESVESPAGSDTNATDNERIDDAD